MRRKHVGKYEMVMVMKYNEEGGEIEKCTERTEKNVEKNQ